jgi:hypothetical protein
MVPKRLYIISHPKISIGKIQKTPLYQVMSKYTTLPLQNTGCLRELIRLLYKTGIAARRKLEYQDSIQTQECL